MDDLISRQAVLDYIDKMPSELTADGRRMIRRIRLTEYIQDSLPSAQQWIPVTERLPKPYEHCLWTTKDGRVIYHHCDGLFSNYTAWMPLPEPYKGEE